MLPKTPVCASTCDALYRACADEYFAEDSLQRLTPCRASDTICTKLSDWVTGGGAEMCAAAGYEVVSSSAAAAAGGWCFQPSASGATSSSSSSSSSSKSSGSKGDKSGKMGKDKRKGKSGGSKQDADEFKKAEAWMKRVYLIVFVSLIAHFGVKWLGRYLKNSSSGAARNAARLAAENRARRSAMDTHYL